MIKLFLYLLSVLIIFLILFNNPTGNNFNSFINQNKLLSFSSNQVFVQKVIFIAISIFLFLNIIINVLEY